MPRIRPVDSPVLIELDGEQLQAREGEPVASALLAAGERLFSRSAKYHRPRGAFCITGACAQCLMRVDGVPNVATCRVAVKAGMRLERQNALPDGKLDLFRANDFVFRDFFNHHEFMAKVPVADVVMQKVARFLSGQGLLPDSAGPVREPALVEKIDTVIVGAGTAGRAAMEIFESLGVPFTVFERDTGEEVVGLFADDGEPFLTVVKNGRLHLVFYQQVLLAMGGHPVLATFPNNDLPGVMAGSAVRTLIQRDGVLPGHRVACVGDALEAQALAVLVTAGGGEALAVGETVVRVHGLDGVNAVTTEQSGKVRCDVVAVCTPASPAFELARAAGAHVTWNEAAQCFVVEADAGGQTARLNVFVAGDARAPASESSARAQGAAAAKAIAARVKS